jgi:TRAP transporter 4TM/12TM fusion protein
MPPVMGAVAFLMADFLELPYREIVIAAIVPSLLYYVSLFIQADLEAAKTGITRVKESEIPRVRAVLWAGWLYILPFAGLIFALFTLNWEAETAAILAAVMIVVLFGDWLVFAAAVTLLGVYYAFNWNGVTAAVVGGSLAISIVLRLIYRGKWMSAKDIWQAFVQTGLSVLDILMIVAGAGFIIGVLQITGLGFAFTMFVVEFGGGNLFLMLVISGLLCIVLGMGMPTVGVYILLAILIAPSLVEVGIDPLAAHMFILYLGMMSLITPPVAVAAFFAASIAKAPPMATGWTCMRFGWTAYVVPFLFVFSPSLLLQGDSPVDLVIDVSSAIAGVWLATAALVGYFARPLDAVHRALYGTAGVLLLIPQEIASWALWTDAAGLVLGVFLVYRDYAETRRLKRASAKA